MLAGLIAQQKHICASSIGCGGLISKGQVTAKDILNVGLNPAFLREDFQKQK